MSDQESVWERAKRAVRAVGEFDQATGSRRIRDNFKAIGRGLAFLGRRLFLKKRPERTDVEFDDV